MEAEKPPRSQRERIVDWNLLGRRLRRPGPWLAAVGLLALLSVAGNAYQFTHPSISQEPTHPSASEEPAIGFRFDEVFVVQGPQEGNNSTLTVTAWYTNQGSKRLGELEFAFYGIESERGVTDSTATTSAAALGGRQTRNASADLHLDARRDYTIRILVLEGGLLVARGEGQVGFQHDHGFVAMRSANSVSGFTYDYGSG